MSLLILTSTDIDVITPLFSPTDLCLLTARVFSLLSSSSSPHRSSLPLPNHKTLIMPARVPSLPAAIKVVSVPTAPDDTRGLPASTIVLDDDTGAVKALVNARSLTALRTAAGSLLATYLIGPKSPRLLLAYGAGKQIDAHIDLHLRFFPSLTSVTIINRSPARLAALTSSLRTRFPGITFTALSSSDSTTTRIISSADLIITATSSTSPLFPGSLPHPGAHITLVGSYTPSMAECDSELIRRAGGRVVVDSREACLKEAGELIGAGVGGVGLVEIGELVEVGHGEGLERLGKQKLCERVREAGDVTIFKSVGVGAQDVAIVDAVLRKAGEVGVGRSVEGYD